MHFNKLILDKKLLYREFDYYIYKKDIIEKIFNDEIIFNLIALSKTEVTDIESFFISAMGADSLGADIAGGVELPAHEHMNITVK